MANFRCLEFERFLRRKVPHIVRVVWEKRGGHYSAVVTSRAGVSVRVSMPGTVTDQPRRRENLASFIRRQLEASHGYTCR